MKSKIYSSKILAMLLVLVLMVTSMPLSIFATESSLIESSNDIEIPSEPEFGVIPKDELEETTVLSEVVSRREENVKHFDIGNGMYQAVTYGSAIHRKDSNGKWQDIDNRLLLDSKNNIYSTADGRTKAAVAVGTNTPLISINENGYTISMTPITTSRLSSSAEIVNHKTRDFDNISGATIKDVAEITNTSSVKYSNVFTATDIEYVLESNDIKENIIVKSPQSSYEYSFRLSVNNLIPVLKQTGDIVFLDNETSEEKYHIPAPFMFDASGDTSYDVYYTLKEGQDGFTITVVANPEWANADDRVFPITIDPTIQKSIVVDTYISSSAPTTNYGSSSELWISSSRISFLRCTMPTIPTGCSFYAANLFVYYYYHSNVTDGDLTAGAYQVMHSWSETGLTWNIAQPSTTTYISSTRLSTGYMSGSRGAYSGSPKTTSFDVTNAAASWYADSTTNYGIALKYESGTNTSVILKSYDAGADYKAYFVITYTEPKIISGVYRIKNAQNGLYLDTTGGGYSAGTEIQQWSQATSDSIRNQLFKITFVRTFGSTDQLNYYTIRPMTNNAMGLESLLNGTERDVTIEAMSTSDDWANLLYNHLWVISKNGSYYTIKNGRIADTSYLTAPSNTTNGETVFTSDTVTSYSKWVLERYTGDSMDGVTWEQFDNMLLPGQSFTYDACMYSSTIGRNGSITYSIANMDGSVTDKATINSSTGRLTAHKPGKIKLRVTYSGAPWVWWRTVYIPKVVEIGCYAQEGFWDVPNSATTATIECNDSSQVKRSVWYLDYQNNGYFTIRNYSTGYHLINSSGTLKHQSMTSSISSPTDSMLWKFTEQSDGTYKISSKANESYYITEKDASHGLSDPNILLSSTSDGNRQKWHISIKEYSVSINNYYDHSFQMRMDNSLTVTTNTLDVINDRQARLNDYLYSEYGIVVVNNTPTRRTSYADLCHGTTNITSTTINQSCSHGTCDGRFALCNHILKGSGSCNSLCNSPFHHNNSLKIHSWYKNEFNNPTADINIMWTGHMNCPEEKIPWSSGTHITATLYNRTNTGYWDYTAFHETGHSLGASGDNTCLNTSCVMSYSTNWTTLLLLVANPGGNMFCDTCESQIRSKTHDKHY